MTCPSCSLETSRDCTVCPHCGARLARGVPSSGKRYAPPRAGWKKPLYPLYRLSTAFGQAIGGLAGKAVGHFAIFTMIPPPLRLTIALSIIPGLGTLVMGHVQRALIFFFSWCLLFLLAMANDPGRFSVFVVLPAAAVHVGAMVDAAQTRWYCETPRELATIVIALTLVVFCLYFVFDSIWGFGILYPVAAKFSGFKISDLMVAPPRGLKR